MKHAQKDSTILSHWLVKTRRNWAYIQKQRIEWLFPGGWGWVCVSHRVVRGCKISEETCNKLDINCAKKKKLRFPLNVLKTKLVCYQVYVDRLCEQAQNKQRYQILCHYEKCKQIFCIYNVNGDWEKDLMFETPASTHIKSGHGHVSIPKHVGRRQAVLRSSLASILPKVMSFQSSEQHCLEVARHKTTGEDT